MNVLFVCTGNTCRSPMAECIFNSLAKGHTAASAGIAAVTGAPASENALFVMSGMGLSLSGHTSRMVDTDMVGCADVVVTMTTQQRNVLSAAFSGAEFVTFRDFFGSVSDIPDPYGLNIATYRATAEIMYEKIRDWLCK